MARKKKDAAEDGAEGSEPKAKGKGNLVPAIVIAIGLIGGGKMMGGGGGAAAEPAAADGTTTTTEFVLGPVVKLDPITLNMADGRYLRVGLGLQLSAEAEGGGGAGHGAPAEPDTSDAAGRYAKALDIVIDSLGGHTYDQLVTPDGRQAAKDELVHLLQEAYHEEISDLYFTEFVLQ